MKYKSCHLLHISKTTKSEHDGSKQLKILQEPVTPLNNKHAPTSLMSEIALVQVLMKIISYKSEFSRFMPPVNCNSLQKLYDMSNSRLCQKFFIIWFNFTGRWLVNSRIVGRRSIFEIQFDIDLSILLVFRTILSVALIHKEANI